MPLLNDVSPVKPEKDVIKYSLAKKRKDIVLGVLIGTMTGFVLVFFVAPAFPFLMWPILIFVVGLAGTNTIRIQAMVGFVLGMLILGLLLGASLSQYLYGPQPLY